MRHLALTLLLLTPALAHADDMRWRLAGWGGVLALENGSTTRTATPEVAAGARWGGEHLLLAATYRFAFRDAGTDLVGVRTFVHRLQLGGRGELSSTHLRYGAELALVPFVETARLHGPGMPTHTATQFGIGPAIGADLALKLGDAGFATLVFIGTLRRQYVDLLASVGVEFLL